MKSTKKKAAFISAMITMATLVSGSALSANATIYTNGHYRGVRGISYCETDFVWTVDNKYNITSSSATQWSEGFLAKEKGADLIYSDPTEHDYCCKCEIGFGKLFYHKVYNDNVALANSGNAWII